MFSTKTSDNPFSEVAPPLDTEPGTQELPFHFNTSFVLGLPAETLERSFNAALILKVKINPSPSEYSLSAAEICAFPPARSLARALSHS